MAKIQGNGVDVSGRNPRGIIYITGDAVTEDSIRLVQDDDDPHTAELQARHDGVWNPTGIEIGSSVAFGHDLLIKAWGQEIELRDEGGTVRALTVAHTLDAVTGTAQAPYTPIMGTFQDNVVIQADFDREFIGNSNALTQRIPATVIATSLHIKTGSVAATTAVVMKVFREGSAEPFVHIIYPASFFPADSDCEMIFDFPIEITNGEICTFSFECVDSVTSQPDLDGLFSLKTDVGGSSWYMGVSYHLHTHEAVMTYHEAQHLFILDPEDHSLYITTDGDLIFESPDTGQIR
jgi:hypothetical protein